MDYIRFLKAPLLMDSKYCALILITIMLLFGAKLGADLEIYIYTLFSIVIIKDIERMKYVINLTLPIDSTFRLKMMYINTYIIYIGGSIANYINYHLIGKYRSLKVSVFVIGVSIIFANLFYYKLCSLEFKEGIIEKLKSIKGIPMLLTILGMLIMYLKMASLPEDLISYMIQRMNTTVQIGILFVVIMLVGITTIFSYKYVLDIVRGNR